MRNLFDACRFITLNGAVDEFRISSVYSTPPAGGCTGGDFLNCVIAGCFSGTEMGLLGLCRGVEENLDSPEKKMNSARTIDADILYFGELIIEGIELILPHRGMHLRKFVLLPLSEVSDRIVPGHDKSPAALLEVCEDESEIVLFLDRPAEGELWKEDVLFV